MHQFKLDDGTLSPAATRLLAADFKDGSDEESMFEKNMLPKVPVAVGETWKCDMPDLVTKQETDYRHTSFSINQWDFGDGTQSGSPEYYPQLTVNHPYNKGGNYTVTLSTTFPRNLEGQLDAWNAGCDKNPLNAAKPDDRFITRTAYSDWLSSMVTISPPLVPGP